MFSAQSALHGPVGPNHYSSPKDILAVRRLMHTLGRSVGDVNTDFMDMLLNEGIVAYQREKGLKPDGVIKPDGETSMMLLRDLDELSRQHPLKRTSQFYPVEEHQVQRGSSGEKAPLKQTPTPANAPLKMQEGFMEKVDRSERGVKEKGPFSTAAEGFSIEDGSGEALEPDHTFESATETESESGTKDEVDTAEIDKIRAETNKEINNKFGTKVLYKMLDQAEGYRQDLYVVEDSEEQSDGSVIKTPRKNSGVTVGTGVDLGEKTPEGLRRLGVPEEIIQKLSPYMGLKGQEAKEFVEANPLRLETTEVYVLDRIIKEDALRDIMRRYNRAIRGNKSLKLFEDLPPEAQTVILSVAYQYRTLRERTPIFWGHVIRQDWKSAVAELRDFKDKDPKRRHKEADLLERILK